MNSKNIRKIFVTGHRNPDIDSLASACALAELRRRQGMGNLVAICPGVLPERAAFLFNRFGLKAPESRNDCYLLIRDIAAQVPYIDAGTTLFEAVNKLRESGLPRLPVVDADGKFLGMLSSVALLAKLLNIGSADGSDFAGRGIRSSIPLISEVMEAKNLTGIAPTAAQEFNVYVAAMSLERFEEHMPSDSEHLAIIVGDRPEIHLRALHRRVKLLIVTGNQPVEPLILKEAAAQHMTVLQTALDSATAIRRLKFSTPVEFSGFGAEDAPLAPEDRVRDRRHAILGTADDVLPVVDATGKCVGAVFKKTLSEPPPYRIIMVDHNEPDQSLPGIEELPVIEVVDHHRIGMLPTTDPIRFTGDVVGSTCTLVAAMFRSAGERLSPELAGLLLGGIVSDTLLLKSPTTATLDIRMCEWLEKLSGVTAADLMAELQKIDSPLATKPAAEVIGSDCKNYTDGEIHFALAQVEETNLELLHQRRSELAEAMQQRLEAEKLDFFGLMVTDAVRENSEFLAIGRRDIVRALPYRPTADGLFFLPGVLSRKKQVLPQILTITSALKQ